MNNYGWGLPVAASTYAGKIDFGIYVIHVAMIGIFVLWGIFFAYLLIKYRQRPGVPAVREDHDDTPAKISIPDSLSKFPFAQLLYKNSGELKSLAPDLIVMLFEIVLIVFYALPVWSSIKMKFPDEKNAVVIRVVAEQFGWNVQYPGPDGSFAKGSPDLVHFNNPLGIDRKDPDAADDVIVANEIHMPVNRPVLIKLTSKDVIHDFFVPEFRIKQDAVPGMEIPVWVEPNRIGHYELACAQLCGFGHSLMRGDVYVDSQEDYDKWLKSRLAATPAAPKPSKPSEDF
ncbi:MAG: cytochrome c oxidase subunit II [Elusimicrobia bacterium]|nr:cytochrome c oxidase subunit II [Elusimicrobiota bacterium]